MFLDRFIITYVFGFRMSNEIKSCHLSLIKRVAITIIYMYLELFFCQQDIRIYMIIVCGFNMSLNERRTYDVAVLGASATSWRGFCMRKRRDNRQWRKFGVMCSSGNLLISTLTCISIIPMNYHA